MVQANSAGARDGRVAAWIDGELIADWQNLRFRSTDALKIDQFEFVLGGASNTDGADRQWFDNLAVATSYIGPMSSNDTAPAPTLGMSVNPSSISENGGTATGTVTRSGSSSGDLVVSLSSNDTGEATVPSSVTILSGSSSATFTVRGVDDNLVDGPRASPSGRPPPAPTRAQRRSTSPTTTRRPRRRSA